MMRGEGTVIDGTPASVRECNQELNWGEWNRVNTMERDSNQYMQQKHSSISYRIPIPTMSVIYTEYTKHLEPLLLP